MRRHPAGPDRPPPARPAGRARGLTRLAQAGAILGYGALASAGVPFRTGTAIAVALPAVAATLVALARRAGRVPAPRPAGAWWPWLALTCAVAALELTEFFASPRPSHPTISWILAGALVHRPVRAAALAGWLAVGAWLAG